VEADCDVVVEQLEALLDDVRGSTGRSTAQLDRVQPAHRRDAENLIQYLELRHHDVGKLQRRLEERGLSSLGRCEPHVLATLEATRAAAAGERVRLSPGTLGFGEGRRALDRNSDDLFGPRPAQRVPRIMVTLPSEAAVDGLLVRRLVAAGMDVARINGAHDDVETWRSMVTNVRAASLDVGRSCRISIDLPGPKLRTGALQPGPRVLRLAPERDGRGRATGPAPVALVGSSTAWSPAGSAVPVDDAWLERRLPGDTVSLHDARGSRRRLWITGRSEHGVQAETWDTTYLESDLTLSCGTDDTTVGELPEVEQFHLLRPGDRLWVTDGGPPAPPWRSGTDGEATIACEVPEVFSAVRVGHRVAFDDGRITGRVEAVETGRFAVRLHLAPGGGAKLRAGKGINLPDTRLALPILSEADEPLLDLAAARADMLGVSFVRDENDVAAVQAALQRRGADHLGLILKIELVAAFARLPQILLQALRADRLGVMIARGDLAVEAGYERVAELQEEIMWLCEAAHVPVIWATEVLDRLARTGRPSRAEITDAAIAQRAECVMLNKGAHIEGAVQSLDDILRRMARHQRKKVPLLKPLRSWYE
jgi:pyruvate kinase